MTRMTEKQVYELVQTYPDFELRRYPSHVVAEVVVRAPFADAGNAAFRTLAGTSAARTGRPARSR